MVIGTIKGLGTINFHALTQRKQINKHYLNQESCNEYDNVNGCIVPIKHPSIYKVTAAQNNVCSEHILEVEADLTDDGRLINFRVV